MPQLEIHHADGNVTYAELTQQKPLMVGSGTNCDIVLSDPSVKRIHCRIVWRADKSEWRVEVAADSGGVTLGGRSVKAGSIRSGDVLGIGSCRLYMDDAKQAARPSSLSDEIESQIHDTTTAPDDDGAEAVHLERSTIRKKAHMRDTRGFWAKFSEGFRKKAKEQLQGETDRPPGQERILGSPLVRWMGLALLVIVVLGVLAYLDYRRRTIIGLFEAAQTAETAGNFEVAMRRFDEFMQTYPSHRLATNARVQRALCEVESNVTSSPSAALADASQMIREFTQSKEPGFAPLKDRITEVMGKVAQNLAESARDRADRKSLERSQEAQEIINRDLQGTKLSPEVEAKLAQTQEAALAAITKFEELGKTLELMDSAIDAAKTFEVYAARERIVMLYGDFAAKPEIEERMAKAQKLDLEAIQWEALGKAAENQPRSGAIATSTLLMDLKAGGGVAAADANVVFVLAGGGLSAHDGNTGKALWSMVVGRDTNVLPMVISPPGTPDPVVLVTDARHDELVAVQAKTGKVVWRQALGEPLEAAPLLHRNKIYQPGGKGSLFVIDPTSGRIDGRLKFGEQRLATTPAADLSEKHLFLLGEQYLLYVITLGNPPKCEDIYYTAHRPDSIIASPLRMLRYLVLCENSTASTVRLRVFLLKPDGTMDSEMQRIPKEGEPPINGWIHSQPAVFANLMFVATDLETVYVYSGGPPERADGFTPVPVKTAGGGTIPPGTRPQAYSMYYNEKNLLVAGSMLRDYLYAAEQPALTPASEKLPGAASQPIQRYPATGGRVDSLYVARRVPASSGIAFTALDSKNLETKWEAVLGTGVLAIQPADASKSAWVVLTRSGHVFSVPAATLAAGGVVDKPIGRIEIEGEFSDAAEPLRLADGSSIFTPTGTPNRLFIRGSAADAQVRPLDLLAPLQRPVALFEDGILIPATDGRIYWISPATGKPLADPFQPPLLADQASEWRGVAVTAKKTIIAVESRGNIYQVEPRKDPSSNLAERNGSKFPKPIRSGIAVSGSIVGCVDEDNVLHIWDAEALTPIRAIKLSAPASLGPVAAGEHLFVAAGDDELVCVNPQGEDIWRHPLKGQNVVGRPLVKGNAVIFVTSSGLVRALRLADGGELWTLDTEKPLSGGPIDINEKLVVIGDDGSLNVVKTPGGGN